VQIEPRGRGLSSRGLPENFSVNDIVLDVAAVVERLGLDNLVLITNGGFGHLAVRYTVAHPGRVRALILGNCSISMSAWPRNFFQGVSAENWDFFIKSQIPASLAPDEARLWFESMTQCSTPEDWQRSQTAYVHSDIDGETRRLRVPTLILHSRRFIFFSPDEAVKLAKNVKDARLVFLDGPFMSGDPIEAFAAIDAFLAELPYRPSAQTPPENTLSHREIEVLRLLAVGRSNQDIADELVISLNTVRRHVSNIFDKTGVANRAEAATFAARNGIS
jgi:DNA-binding CsgD family transcriptional regulator/pimeloyl-ACP methyl ester carboxylesterase